jgi:hypothetical protein
MGLLWARILPEINRKGKRSRLLRPGQPTGSRGGNGSKKGDGERMLPSGAPRRYDAGDFSSAGAFSKWSRISSRLYSEISVKAMPLPRSMML